MAVTTYLWMSFGLVSRISQNREISGAIMVGMSTAKACNSHWLITELGIMIRAGTMMYMRIDTSMCLNLLSYSIISHP